MARPAESDRILGGLSIKRDEILTELEATRGRLRGVMASLESTITVTREEAKRGSEAAVEVAEFEPTRRSRRWSLHARSSWRTTPRRPWRKASPGPGDRLRGGRELHAEPRMGGAPDRSPRRHAREHRGIRPGPSRHPDRRGRRAELGAGRPAGAGREQRHAGSRLTGNAASPRRVMVSFHAAAPLFASRSPSPGGPATRWRSDPPHAPASRRRQRWSRPRRRCGGSAPARGRAGPGRGTGPGPGSPRPPTRRPAGPVGRSGRRSPEVLRMRR